MTTTPEFSANPTTPDPAPAAGGRKPLTRSANERIFGGVCGGIAEHTGIDVALIRIFTIVAGLFTFGGAVVAYIAAYAVMSSPTGERSPVQRWQDKRRRR